MKRFQGYLILAALAAAAIIAVWGYFKLGTDNVEKTEIQPAKPIDLRPIARLCTMEIYREATVLDTVNGKVLFGIQKQRGEISFDIEDLPRRFLELPDTLRRADTLHIKLPQARIELLEATEPDSWRVLDTKSLSLFKSAVMSASEENQAKRKAIKRAKQRLYDDGTVEWARKEAAATLERTLPVLTGHPVKVDY